MILTLEIHYYKWKYRDTIILIKCQVKVEFSVTKARGTRNSKENNQLTCLYKVINGVPRVRAVSVV